MSDRTSPVPLELEEAVVDDSASEEVAARLAKASLGAPALRRRRRLPPRRRGQLPVSISHCTPCHSSAGEVKAVGEDPGQPGVGGALTPQHPATGGRSCEPAHRALSASMSTLGLTPLCCRLRRRRAGRAQDPRHRGRGGRQPGQGQGQTHRHASGRGLLLGGGNWRPCGHRGRSGRAAGRGGAAAPVWLHHSHLRHLLRHPARCGRGGTCASAWPAECGPPCRARPRRRQPACHHAHRPSPNAPCCLAGRRAGHVKGMRVPAKFYADPKLLSLGGQAWGGQRCTWPRGVAAAAGMPHHAPRHNCRPCLRSSG